MGMNFDSPLAFAEHLMKAATVELLALNKGLTIAAQLIQNEAKNEIGVLQDKIGSLSVGDSWPDLSESTVEEKERLGYGNAGNDWQPLLRTGELRDSIHYEINMPKFEAIIGSESPIAAFQEFGTNKIPPRPFIGRAAYILSDKIAKIFGQAMMIGIAGGRVIGSDIGKQTGYHQDINL